MMHKGCSGSFQTGKEIVDKIRMMGFSKKAMLVPFKIVCVECDHHFHMDTHEGQCPHCRMVYGVTPCHASDPKNIMAAGIDY